MRRRYVARRPKSANCDDIRRLYVASPFWDINPLVRIDRYYQIVSMREQFDDRFSKEFDYVYWAVVEAAKANPAALLVSATRQDNEVCFEAAFAKLKGCDELYVCQFEGWEESVGVRREIEYMASANKPVRYIK